VEQDVEKLKHDMLKLVAESSCQLKNISAENEKLKGVIGKQLASGVIPNEMFSIHPPMNRKRKIQDGGIILSWFLFKEYGKNLKNLYGGFFDRRLCTIFYFLNK